MRRWSGLAALAIVVVLVGAACSKSSPSAGTTAGGTTTGSGGSTTGSSGGGKITIGGDTANNHGTKTVSGMSSFELEADNEGTTYYFKPTTLTGKPGQTLKLEIKNEGNTKHNFSIEDQKINEDLDPGKSVTVTVTFPNSGSVEFFCEYHHSLGMVGQLQAS